MEKIIDPAVLIMENVSSVDVDSYVKPSEDSSPKKTEEKKTEPVPDQMSQQVKTRKKKEKSEKGAPIANFPKMAVLNVRASTVKRFRLSKSMYEATVGRTVTVSEYLEMLIDTGLNALSPKAAKMLSVLDSQEI